MPERNVINEHMEIIDVEGVHVGIVDRVEDHRIKLTKSDDGSEHRYVATSLVQDIRGNTVTLKKVAAVALSSDGEA
jgi:hypothetical protein